MIPYGKHHLDEDDIQAVVEILKSNALTQGPTINLFEEAVAKYVGVKYAVCVSSGTAALHLAYLAGGLDAGESIVTSPITFVSTANAARFCGADVLFCDVDSSNINLDPNNLQKILDENSNIRIISPVHFGGLPCDMEPIKNLADKYGTLVVEDAAHAFGASYKNGKKVGCCENSHMTIFSFHPVKSIAAGEGGMITTNDYSTYLKLLKLRSHGINKLDEGFINSIQAFDNNKINPWYYEMQELGFHYRNTDIQCSLALSQLKKIDKFIQRRRQLALNYDELFKKHININLIQTTGRLDSSNHIYVLRINFKEFGLSRREFMNSLKSKGIGSQVHYMPVYKHPYYSNFGYCDIDYPNSETYYNEAISIPLYYDLKDEEQLMVFDVITNALKQS